MAKTNPKKVSIFKAVTEDTPQLSKGKSINSTKRGKRRLPSQSLVKTQVSTDSTKKLSKRIKKENVEDIPLHADMFKVAFLILQEAGYCNVGKTKDGSNFLILLPTNMWEDDLTLKA